MGSTNKTTNLELSQFLGSDSPKWLTDYNADMQKIDSAVGAVQSQADATDLVVSGHSTAIDSLQTTTGEQGTAISDLRTDVNHNAGDINTINSLIGNGEPTTTDKTIIGAINEINRSTIDLPNNFVIVGRTTLQVNTDGIKTNSEMLTELKNAVAAWLTNHDCAYITTVTIQGVRDCESSGNNFVTPDNIADKYLYFNGIVESSTALTVYSLQWRGSTTPKYSHSVIDNNGYAFTDDASVIATHNLIVALIELKELN